MKIMLFAGAAKASLLLLCIINLWAPGQALGAGDFPGMPYCSVPPWPGAATKANVLLMLDNSASMYDPAYTDPSAFCIDDSYDNEQNYPGYFDQATVYSYNAGADRFDPSALTLPSGCNAANNAYLCLNLNGSPNRVVDRFLATGKFLNWLAMSKLDLEKQVLTGGKFVYNATGNGGTLLPETRGCQGSRMVKVVLDRSRDPKAPFPFTFAVRGPVPGESDYLNNRGGATRIELYDRKYNKAECLAALADWRTGNLAALRADAGKCLGAAGSVETVAGSKIPSKYKLLVDIMSNCYANPNNVLGDGSVLLDCRLRLAKKYLGNCDGIVAGSGDEVCGANFSHRPAVHQGVSNSTGFMGECYHTDSGYQMPCAEEEAQDFCAEITTPALTDPSRMVNLAGTEKHVPGYILDVGIYGLGEKAGTFSARVSTSSAPTGLIQAFSDDINFGAMVFNDNGAGSECKHEDPALKDEGINDGEIACIKRCKNGSTETAQQCHRDADCAAGYQCLEILVTDGGRVISPVGSPLGDHQPNSGLVAALDGIQGSSWSPLAESFYNALGYFANRSDLRLQEADFGLPVQSQFNCQKNHILMVSDGISSADRHSKVNELVANAVSAWVNPVHGMPASQTTTGGESSPPFRGSYNVDDLAWIARNRNIADFSKEPLQQKEYLSTHVVYTGVPCGDPETGAGYDAYGSCTTADEGVPEKLLQLAAAKGGGKIARVNDPAALGQTLGGLLQQIAAGSGAEPAILSSGDGNGAVYLQEQFYPEKSFDGGKSSVSWIGEMQSLWYYIDPFIGSSAGSGSAIREDTLDAQKLDLKNDRIVDLRFDSASKRTYAYLTTDSNGDGISEGVETRVELDQLKSLWRAGQMLWERDLSAAPRTIYTPLLRGGSQFNGTGLMKFSWGSPEAVRPYLDLKQGDPDADKLMQFIHGLDPEKAALRSRTVRLDARPEVVVEPKLKGVGVWKLGDIIASSPQLQSSAPLGGYHLSAPSGYNDLSYRWFIGELDAINPSPVNYKERGMVYVGANDGMLHAFKLGQLKQTNAGGAMKAELQGSDLGREQWAFIPKNALPYLKYLSDPDYRHLHYVDGKLTLVDASIGDFSSGSCNRESYWNCPKISKLEDGTLDPARSTWRTVLIGSMGLGGGACLSGTDCVPVPVMDPDDPGKALGYSSYFALDVTDPERPSLLWEFSHPALGYSTSGPAIIRVGDPADSGNGSNGRWFAVFGSGPTGPIDGATHQFLGRSNQTLKFFVVDLRTGTLVRTIDTLIADAFAGTLIGGGIDTDKWKPTDPGNYRDDAIYVGYTKKSSSTGAWSEGGVLRIITQQSLHPDSAWSWSKVMEGIGPVTARIARLQDRRSHNLWLYFGSGRYFFSQDDMQLQRALYGVKDPCYNYKPMGVDHKLDRIDASCTASVSAASLVDQSGSQVAVGAADTGWRIDLDAASGAVGAERVITNPTAVTGGAVFFTTFQPNTDRCLFGDSYLWGVTYDTGGAIVEGTVLGKVLARLATGALKDVGLSAKLTDKGGRRGPATPGQPVGIKVVSNSGLRPLKKIIHIQER